ncbi:hypothetical protein HGA92_04650 [Candidatus Gracilibacteria bacterium]|nr:hypothetical protein [Candidatus Gracilibacteria bacterium]NUJ98476.1 hypothetical protein [Candidatus Gracilibacteria bacterium]
MSADTINQDDIKILEAQEDLKLVVNPEIIDLLTGVVEGIKKMVEEISNLKNVSEEQLKPITRKKQNNQPPENSLKLVMEIGELLENKELNGSRQRVENMVRTNLQKLPEDVKGFVEIVLGSSLKTEIKK